MGKKRPVFEFKGLSGLLGSSSSSSSTPTTYYSPYSRHHSRRHRRHHRHKPRHRYSRRKHFAADQRRRRRKAQRRREEDAEYLAEQARREEQQRNSRKESVLGTPVDAISAHHSSRNEEYFQRVRQETASAGFAEDDYVHDPVPHPLNGSPPVYPQPPTSQGLQQAGSQNSRPRRPYSDRAKVSERRDGENEAGVEVPTEQQEDEEADEDGDDLLAGGRGLLRKFAKGKLFDAVTTNKPKKKRTLLATAGALATAAALAFAGKKLWDKRKEQRKEEEEQEDDEALEMYGATGPFDSEGIFLGPNPLNLVPPPTTFSVRVPQNEAFIVERGGRFHRKLNAGSNTLIPCMDHIAFRYSLKEASMPISWQQCFTRDNVPIRVNALLFIRVDDPVSASYEIDNAYHAVIMLVQSSIKREFNKLTVEQAYTDRYPLDHVIKDIINTASRAWGIRCTRFEIKEVELPEDLRLSLENAAAADRQRREEVRAAEAQCEIMVNRAEAEMQLQMRRSQARQVDMVNQAIGEAHAISERSEAIANAMRDLAEAVSGPDGEKAMQMRIAEQYLQAYGQIASGGPNPPPGPDPRQVASTMNDAIGLLNTLGHPSASAHNPYVIPQANPFENAPGIQPETTGVVVDGTTAQAGVPDVPTTPIHGQPQQYAPGLPQGVITPDMSQTTSQHGAGSSTLAGHAVTAYPQPKIGKKGALKLKGTPRIKPRS